ncbi:MAG: putative formate dehydrogenase [Alphaproteobacteria bacterium MarineAlpha9_Bin7]|nr:MAG: putative formate dehydrogenase [Alphaproteobacteria bacterium MarineAlpha9_Bin7]
MTDTIAFALDGREVLAQPGETIWEVAQRSGIEIPHLCYSPAPGYRPDGNCRTCMVEIEGERVLASSCNKLPETGMVVHSVSERARFARAMVIELLVADQPTRSASHDPDSEFWQWAERIGQVESRFPKRVAPPSDPSHPAMLVNLDSCIHCTLCVRACREVQVNDVIGMARRGAANSIVFDMGDGMGESSCVACGECVQACPTGALLPVTTKTENEPREVNSLCPYCGVGCQLTYQIEGDRIVSVVGRDGPANRGRLCVKGRFGFDYIHHSHRLISPLVRKDGVPKLAEDYVDPGNPYTHFREATWDEALDLAAAGLARIREQHGGQALSGFGCAKGSNEEAYLVQKMVRTGFGTNNVDHCTRLCHASSVAALMETIGSGAVTAPFSESVNADVLMVVGANPTENHPVAATFFKNAVKAGAKMVVMDPRGQTLKRHADYMIQNKPGTDVAVLNALMHVIVQENLYDEEYVQSRTDGFEELRVHLLDYSPESMSEHCGIPAGILREVARLYGNAERAMIFWGMGVSQHIHGTDNARCLISLALLTGQVGRPGTGLHPLRGQNNVQGASDSGLIPMVYPDYQPVSDPSAHAFFEEFWGATLNSEPGLTVVEIADSAHEGTMKGMYVMGENPAMSDPNASHVREALCNLEHLVVQDIFLTETAVYADVILPASAFPEKDGTFTNTDRRVQIGRQALDPPGDARQDWWIVQEIARRIGLDWNYDGPRSIFEEMRGCMPSIAGITWDRLCEEGAVTYPCRNVGDPGDPIIFGDGFPTPDGRGKLIPVNIIPPDEVPDEDFPMVLTTGRHLEHWHTGVMTRRARVLDELEPEAVCEISPADARRLGIVPGAWVRVTSRRGVIELKARITGSNPEGLVFIPFCYSEAAVNLLTNPKLDPFGKIPELKFCSVRLEEIDFPRVSAPQ